MKHYLSFKNKRKFKGRFIFSKVKRVAHRGPCLPGSEQHSPIQTRRGQLNKDLCCLSGTTIPEQLRSWENLNVAVILSPCFPGRCMLRRKDPISVETKHVLRLVYGDMLTRKESDAIAENSTISKLDLSFFPSICLRFFTVVGTIARCIQTVGSKFRIYIRDK